MTTRMRTAAVIAARDGDDRIARIIDQCCRMPVDEIYVVCCGSDERTMMTARRNRARIVEAGASCPDGTAVSLGVSQSRSADAFLCIDGRYVYPAEWLLPYIDAASKGADVVLNDISATPTRMSGRELCAAFLNCALGASHAGINSLTVFPFCLSRKAVEEIGPKTLASLPSALLIAHLKGLRIDAVGPLPTSTLDPCLARVRGDSGFPVTESGGHLEAHLDALTELLAARGPRGAFSDHNRRRDLLVEGWR